MAKVLTSRAAAVVGGAVARARGQSRYSHRFAARAAGNATNESLCRPLEPPAHLPSLDSFAAHLRTQQPVPLYLPSLVHPSNPNASVPWPAVLSWSQIDDKGRETLAGLRNEQTEPLLVQVEVGRRSRGYLDAEPGSWQQLTMPFGLFMDAFIAGSIPRQDSTSQNLIGYVAQQDLLSQCPLLDAACPALPHTRVGPKGDREQWRSNVWIGPSDTFTPLHRDPYENLFVQVVGRKRVHLFPPSAAPHLYLRTNGSQQNTSVVPTERYLLRTGDREREADFPALNQAADDPGACHVTLEAGDALYIPRGWLHCVASLSTSASVNFWWR
ncbi:unnamed protein product [Parajaminaea phylloscopi]